MMRALADRIAMDGSRPVTNHPTGIAGAMSQDDTQGHRSRPIRVPSGGFQTNEDEARWLAETLKMRIGEVLQLAGVNATVAPIGLYDLLLLSLNSASKRATSRLTATLRRAREMIQRDRDTDFGRFTVGGDVSTMDETEAAVIAERDAVLAEIDGVLVDGR